MQAIGANALLVKMGIKDHDECFSAIEIRKLWSIHFGIATRYFPFGVPSRIASANKQTLKVELSPESVLLSYTRCTPFKSALLF